MMEITRAPFSTSQVATEGLRRMEASKTRAAREAGDVYLGSIASSAGGPEQVVASAVREAAAQRVKDASATTAQRVALQVLAGGLSGAAGTALVRIGLLMLDAVKNPGDAAAMAGTLLARLDRNGTSSMADALAETVRIAGTNCLDPATATAVFKEGLEALSSAGDEGLETRLARFGLAARAHAGEGDSRAVAQIVLQQLEKHSSNPEIRTLAHRAFEEAVPSRPGPWANPFGSGSSVDDGLRTRLEEVLGLAMRADEQAAAARAEEMQKMAQAGSKTPSEAGRIEMGRDAVVIGGVRVEKRAPSTAG